MRVFRHQWLLIKWRVFFFFFYTVKGTGCDPGLRRLSRLCKKETRWEGRNILNNKFIHPTNRAVHCVIVMSCSRANWIYRMPNCLVDLTCRGVAIQGDVATCPPAQIPGGVPYTPPPHTQSPPPQWKENPSYATAYEMYMVLLNETTQLITHGMEKARSIWSSYSFDFSMTTQSINEGIYIIQNSQAELIGLICMPVHLQPPDLYTSPYCILLWIRCQYSGGVRGLKHSRSGGTGIFFLRLIVKEVGHVRGTLYPHTPWSRQ